MEKSVNNAKVAAAPRLDKPGKLIMLITYILSVLFIIIGVMSFIPAVPTLPMQAGKRYEFVDCKGEYRIYQIVAEEDGYYSFEGENVSIYSVVDSKGEQIKRVTYSGKSCRFFEEGNVYTITLSIVEDDAMFRITKLN